MSASLPREYSFSADQSRVSSYLLSSVLHDAVSRVATSSAAIPAKLPRPDKRVIMAVLEKNATDYNGNATRRSSRAHADAALHLRVPDELAGLRLDQALVRLLPEYSRTRLQNWVRDGRVMVNGAPAQPKAKVWSGDRLAVSIEPDQDALANTPQPIALNILYEDPEILVVDKPAGLVVHPGSGNPDGTLLNALLHHAPSLAKLPRAGI